MINTVKERELESLPIGVSELPGEPAIVINGVPNINPSGSSLLLSTGANDIQENANVDAECFRNASLGEWLEGRDVQKLFGDKLYTGTVTEFDKESGCYRVVYEDGDYEDVEWRELEKILVPLDITLPLKSLASKIIKKNQKTTHKSGKIMDQPKAKSLGNKGTADGGSGS